MENNGYINIWKKINHEIQTESEDRLILILKKKIRKVLNWFLFHFGFATIILSSFTVFLTIAVINKWTDPMYRYMNLFLIILNLVGLTSSVSSVIFFRKYHAGVSLKLWLESRIKILSNWLQRKSSYYILPFTFIFCFLSIHVYKDGRLLKEVIQDSRFLSEIPITFLVGIIAGYIVLILFKKIDNTKLIRLKKIHQELTEG